MIFLELFFKDGALETVGFHGRSGLEDELDRALMDAGLGEVTGGGGGIYGSNIDIEVHAKRFEEALQTIARVLLAIHAPQDTLIIRHKPKRIEYRLSDFISPPSSEIPHE